MKRLAPILCLFLLKASFSADTKPSISKDKAPRIINGQAATLGQFPWQTALFFQGPPGSDFWFCGGSIISDTWILTAGHCVHGAESVLVYTGLIDISLDLQPTSISKELFLHEEFASGSLANDVALVKVPKPLSLDENTQTIPLSSDEIQVGTTITVSGWGKTSANESGISPFLSYLDLVTISNEECQKLYGTTGNILSDMVCAATNPSPVQTPCHGDSGGPVVVDFGTNPKHVAVASFVSDRGCESGFPSGYTRTASYIDWIKKKTGI